MSRNVVAIVGVGLLALVGVMQHHLTAQVVETVPAVATVPAVVSPTYVAVPAPQQEVITTAPSPSYVWVPGTWERTPDKWSWKQGTWVQPPFSNAYWVPGYWKHGGGQYQWSAGHWAASAQGVVVEKPVTIPPVYEEVQPAAPVGATNVAWQPGYWDWRGTWVWVPGQYVTETTPNLEWVAGQWVAGTDGLWRWSPAHWATV